ncbi:MAG TPA: sulfite reductase subunit alpha [Rhodocyclaceae bacterium]|nr:sulfite reductase subunit alpha [Rhodocyclaceae bacterium]
MLPTALFLNPLLSTSLAFAMLAAYGLMCVRIALRERRKLRAMAAFEPALADSPSWLLCFASQTGTAEELAMQSAARLHLAGISAHVCSFTQLTAELLQQTERILFVVSTYGEGDPPDNAARFSSATMSARLPLANLHYGLLALGDASYVHPFGFGRDLHAWLQQCSAQALFKPIEVDRGDERALQAWQQELNHLAGSSDVPDWQAPDFGEWRLSARKQLNPGSSGAPLFHLELVPASGPLPNWQSGDLVQIQVPADTTRPRDYSISSLPEDGSVQLLVRQHQGPEGMTGLASNWLTQELELGALVHLRLRSHRLFQLGENISRPLILIGNGSGLAGLRGHLKARIAAGRFDNWLIFGERNAATDFLYQNELAAWLAQGKLARLNAVFSRDQAESRYVQTVLAESSELVREWVNQGAAIYVCGSLKGMASGVNQVLTDVLGEAVLETLSLAGRYRRDVY